MAAATFELNIEKLVAGGEGLGFTDGKAVFVPGVLPQERVIVETVESRPDFSRAALRGILTASPYRRDPACALAGICGGCNWLHIDYSEQLEQKKAIVLEAFRRIGGIRLEEAEIQPSAPLGYRSRIQVHRGDGGALGFMGVRSNTVVAVRSCPVTTPAANRVFSASPPAGLARFTVFGRDLSYACEGIPDGEEVSLEVCGARIRFSVRCFFQSNMGALEKLIPFVKDALGGASDRREAAAADLFCGVGLFGAHLSADFAGITAVESDRLSISYAKKNIPRGRNKFFAVSVENWTAEKQALGRFEAVIVDPPRTGLSRKVRNYLAGNKPGRLVYVSCNPVTLARDLSSLLASGFGLAGLRLFDFYPQTSHVEAVAVLESA
jgi:23S rRNA (uracil1939-C5)-methyltransferase